MADTGGTVEPADEDDRLAVAIFEGWNAEVEGELVTMKLVRSDGREHSYSPYALARDAAISIREAQSGRS